MAKQKQTIGLQTHKHCYIGRLYLFKAQLTITRVNGLTLYSFQTQRVSI